MTHLIVRSDGRTELHGDVTEVDIEQMREAVARIAPEYETARAILGGNPLPVPLTPLTLWVAESTVLRCDGLRNLPASLLPAQYDREPVLLCGTVVITGDPPDPTTWQYVQSLIDDMTRAINGLDVPGCAEPAWPGAVRLAAGYLNAIDRMDCRMPTIADEAAQFLLGTFRAEGGN